MAIAPYPFLIMFNFVMTFTIYPGPTFSKSFDNIDTAWKVIIFNMAYNIGDTAGKYAAGIKNAFNRKSLLFIFFSRLYFFLPVTFMAKAADVGDILTDNVVFPFFICFLFAFTNGFVVSTPLLSQTAPSSWPSEWLPSLTKNTQECSADCCCRSASCWGPSSKFLTRSSSASKVDLYHYTHSGDAGFFHHQYYDYRLKLSLFSRLDVRTVTPKTVLVNPVISRPHEVHGLQKLVQSTTLEVGVKRSGREGILAAGLGSLGDQVD